MMRVIYVYIIFYMSPHVMTHLMSVLGMSFKYWYSLSFLVPRKFGVEYEWSIENLEFYSSIWSILRVLLGVLKKLETR